MLKNLRKAFKRCIVKEAKSGGWYAFSSILFEYRKALIEALREAPEHDVARIERKLVEFYDFCNNH